MSRKLALNRTLLHRSNVFFRNLQATRTCVSADKETFIVISGMFMYAAIFCTICEYVRFHRQSATKCRLQLESRAIMVCTCSPGRQISNSTRSDKISVCKIKAQLCNMRNSELLLLLTTHGATEQLSLLGKSLLSTVGGLHDTWFWNW